MTYNESIKQSNYKWRENNREKFNEYMREYYKVNMLDRNKISYLKHNVKRREDRKNKYYVEKEFKKFLNILL